MKPEATLAPEYRAGLCSFVPEDGAWVRRGALYHPRFAKCLDAVRTAGFQSLLEEGRLLALTELSIAAATRAEGELIELGVYKGGAAAAVGWRLLDAGLVRPFHLCDTFRGLPKPLEWELHEESDFDDTNLETVSRRLHDFLTGFPFEFHEGLFSEVLPGLVDKRFCFAHVDADLYLSVRQACEFAYPRMSPNGIIVFDDYGAPTCPGAKTAVDEFFADKMERPSHIARCAFGVVMGHHSFDFQRFLRRRTFLPSVGGAVRLAPRRKAGAAARALAKWATSPARLRTAERVLSWNSMNIAVPGSELRSAKRIAVIRPDTIGDLALMSCFLRCLRASAETSRISLFVDERFLNIVELCPYVDEVLGLPGVAQAPVTSRLRSIRFSRRQLVARGFDLVLLPRWDVDYYESTTLAYFSGAGTRVGFSEQVRAEKRLLNRGLDGLLTRAIDDRHAKHEVCRNLDFLRAIGGTADNDALELWLDGNDRKTAGEALEGHGVRSGIPAVAIAPGAGHAKRRWPVKRFIAVGRRLAREHGAKIVVVGGAGDAKSGATMAEALGSAVVDLTGRLTLRETAAVLGRLDLMISNDSGPMHLAAAAGIPVVEVSCHPSEGDPLHPNSPVRFHPWVRSHRVVQPEAAQEPCASSCESPEGHCILGVSVESVWAATAALLSS